MRTAKTLISLIWVVAGRTCHFVGFVVLQLINILHVYGIWTLFMEHRPNWAASWKKQQNGYAVWSDSSLCAHWVAKDPSFLHADSEGSDQTGRKPRLIWVFAGRTLTLLVLSCRGSINLTLLMPSVPFLGHRQAVKSQIRRRRMIRVYTVCTLEFL